MLFIKCDHPTTFEPDLGTGSLDLNLVTEFDVNPDVCIYRQSHALFLVFPYNDHIITWQVFLCCRYPKQFHLRDQQATMQFHIFVVTVQGQLRAAQHLEFREVVDL